MSSLPKPVLRGHIKRRGIKGIIGALIFAAFNSGMYNFLVIRPKKKTSEEFYKNYDAAAHFHELERAGYFKPFSVYK